MNCAQCREKCVVEVANLVDLGRLIVEGCHGGKCESKPIPG
jgi:hypothetical protein